MEEAMVRDIGKHIVHNCWEPGVDRLQQGGNVCRGLGGKTREEEKTQKKDRLCVRRSQPILARAGVRPQACYGRGVISV